MANRNPKGKAVAAMIAAGAHMVRCRADKKAIDEGWQDAPWDGKGRHHLAGWIPGRSGWCCIDIDLPKDCPRPEQVLSERVAGVHAVLGEPAVTFTTLSGGRHLYYPVAGDGVVGNRKLTVGDLRCDHGYAILWGSAALEMAALLKQDLSGQANRPGRPHGTAGAPLEDLCTRLWQGLVLQWGQGPSRGRSPLGKLRAGA